ncbi:hypothetical protein JR316_0011912 [Psilocybe cubensis]|uniref:Uncharacterized protein n=2 Tax=Psilocybe cubensis TaxID=181762 RepID=A0A8H8CFC5_PSICU|nr:hypothetical protein JR316_0011912 [Psilocybe cubensis]KAH9476337.1 hypothetical protein JR316_0011912 [Psilocybe cubensis]
MQIFARLNLLAVLGAILAANYALASPLPNDGLQVMARSDAVEATVYTVDAADLDALMNDPDFSISDFVSKVKSAANTVKSAANTVKEGIKTAATVAKPIVDTAAQIAQFTPLAPEAAIITKVVEYVSLT